MLNKNGKETMYRTLSVKWVVWGSGGTEGRLMDVEGAECWRPAGDRMVAEEGKTRATDFSIAAIMARSAAEPRSPVARSPPLTGNLGLSYYYNFKTFFF